MNQEKSKAILIFTWLISILIVIVAGVGIFGKETYIIETPNWRDQSIGQDKIDLFIIAPVLFISGIKAYHKKTNFLIIFGGCLIFFVYTFVIYCFALHFNSLFLVYCLILGLTFYGFVYVFYRSYQQLKNNLSSMRLPVKSLRIYLSVTASIFYFLWLREDVTAILLQVPSITLTEAGLFTNPVHVLDLAFVLPGFFIVVHLLKKKIRLGKLLVYYILVFSVLMEINIAGLVLIMNSKNAISFPWVSGFMIALAAITFLLTRIIFGRLQM